MLRIRLFVVACLLALMPFLLAGEVTTIDAKSLQVATQLREQALKDDTGWNIVEGLTTEVGSRLAGSPNDAKARQWMSAKFQSLGFDRVWTEPVKYPKWVRRAEQGEILAPFPQPLALTALGGSVGTSKNGLSGEIIGFKTLAELKTADALKVKDKIVYLGFRMQAKKDGADYAEGSKGRWDGPSIAARLGAKAYLLRSAGTDSHRLPHTGVLQYATDAAKIPAAALSSPDADLIEHMLSKGQPVKVKLMLDCGLLGEYTGANVMAELTGSEKPEEVFVMGGHLDSWDPGTGAIDDAAGVAITTAAAHLIARLSERPKRSIRVIAFANEEAGVYGGKAYAQAHAAEISQHILGSESDFGADRIWQLRASVKPEALGAIDQMMQVLGPLGVVRHEGTASGGPDLAEMHKRGMAALSLWQDGTRYFDWHHTANDTLDKIDPEQLRQNVAVYAVVAYLAAQANGDFGSAPGAFSEEGGE